MDTDDLSTEAYRGIIIEAERFDHDLDTLIQDHKGSFSCLPNTSFNIHSLMEYANYLY
jgi:hypothetical protein